MKQSNRDCKIVRDLLPSYIDDLTDEVTNEFINEHIGDCPACAKFLKEMNGEIKLDVINQEKEIKYLKKIRRRVKQTIAIVSLIVIIVAACAVGYVYMQSKIQVNNYTFLQANYVKENIKIAKDGKIYGTLIAVFDEKDICISIRIIQEGYKTEYLKEKSEVLTENLESTFENFFVKKNNNYEEKGDTIHYNINTLNGYSKEEVIKYWIENYSVENIKEI